MVLGRIYTSLTLKGLNSGNCTN